MAALDNGALEQAITRFFEFGHGCMHGSKLPFECPLSLLSQTHFVQFPGSFNGLVLF